MCHILPKIRESVPWPYSGISLLKLPTASESLHVSSTKVFPNHHTGLLEAAAQMDRGLTGAV